jgi:hypothetical protein
MRFHAPSTRRARASTLGALMTIGAGWTIGALLAGSLSARPGVDVRLREDDIERALRVGRGLDDERARFHRPYLLTLNDAVVDQIEIVTEFRRVVLFAEERIRRGDHLFGLRQAEEALRPWRGRLTIAARLRFHPLNTYVMAPAFQIVLGQPPMPSIDLRQTALEAPPDPARRTKGPARLTGAVVEADFDAALVGRLRQVVRVISEDQEVARKEVDFGQLE